MSLKFLNMLNAVGNLKNLQEDNVLQEKKKIMLLCINRRVRAVSTWKMNGNC